MLNYSWKIFCGNFFFFFFFFRYNKSPWNLNWWQNSKNPKSTESNSIFSISKWVWSWCQLYQLDKFASRAYFQTDELLLIQICDKILKVFKSQNKITRFFSVVYLLSEVIFECDSSIDCDSIFFYRKYHAYCADRLHCKRHWNPFTLGVAIITTKHNSTWAQSMSKLPTAVFVVFIPIQSNRMKGHQELG